MIFEDKKYLHILESISEKYVLLRFDDDYSKYGKRFFLRHDVDISPLNALKLANIENSLGIKTNYFFQIGAETYNILSFSTIEIIQKIREMGHLAGLHIDQRIFGEEEAAISNTLKWFNNNITKIDFAVSFHKPTNSVLRKRYHHFINTYQTDYFNEDIYLADSARNEEFYPKLLQWIKADKETIQLLIHPEWWCNILGNKEIFEEIVNRRSSETKQYLKSNFNKVFGLYVKDEDSSFRV